MITYRIDWTGRNRIDCKRVLNVSWHYLTFLRLFALLLLYLPPQQIIITYLSIKRSNDFIACYWRVDTLLSSFESVCGHIRSNADKFGWVDILIMSTFVLLYFKRFVSLGFLSIFENIYYGGRWRVSARYLGYDLCVLLRWHWLPNDLPPWHVRHLQIQALLMNVRTLMFSFKR